MKFCTSCGNQLSDGANFCTNCGAVQGAQGQQMQQVKESPFKKLMANKKSKLFTVAVGALLAIVLLVVGICSFIGKDNNIGRLKPEAFKIKENSKWGLMDNKGKIIVEPKYDDIDDMYEGLAAVEIDGKWGYIDSKGKVVIEPTFDDAGPFNEGVAPVSEGYNKWGLINKDGKYVASPEYSIVSYAMEGMAIVSKDGKYGYINTKGKVVIDIKYSRAGLFVNGYAIVNDGTKSFYINKKGQNKFKDSIIAVSNFSEGLARAFIEDEDYGNGVYINTDGKTILTNVNGGKFSEGLAVVYSQADRKYGYINKDGKFKIKAEFDAASEFSEGLAVIVENGKCGYINKKGKVVIETDFDSAEPFSNGVARVETEDGWGYINKKGKMLWEYKEDYDF